MEMILLYKKESRQEYSLMNVMLSFKRNKRLCGLKKDISK